MMNKSMPNDSDYQDAGEMIIKFYSYCYAEAISHEKNQTSKLYNIQIEINDDSNMIIWRWLHYLNYFNS